MAENHFQVETEGEFYSHGIKQKRTISAEILANGDQLQITNSLQAQAVKWKSKKKAKPKLELFHSTQSAHFATATFLRKGEFEYEISHRFLPPMSTDKAFLGIDGPSRIRMGLA